MILLSFLALILCFIYLARIVDLYFISSLDKISSVLKLSSDAAGATLMAVGSSAPELFVALISVLRPGNHESIAIGSIVGSAIFNLLVIVGAVALVRKTKLTWQPIARDIGFYFIAVSLLLYFILDGNITITDATIFLVVYILYVIAVIYWKKILPYPEKNHNLPSEEVSARGGFVGYIDRTVHFLFPNKKHFYWIFIISIILIAFLSWALVELAINISAFLNIPEAIIALTVLAIGTSVPDLFSSIIVAKQGRGEMAVSNAIGSNIFDILVGLGLPLMIYMFLSGEVVNANNDNLLNSSIILFGSVVLMLLFLIIGKWRIGKGTGLVLIGLYLFYIIRKIIFIL